MLAGWTHQHVLVPAPASTRPEAMPRWSPSWRIRSMTPPLTMTVYRPPGHGLRAHAGRYAYRNLLMRPAGQHGLPGGSAGWAGGRAGPGREHRLTPGPSRRRRAGGLTVVVSPWPPGCGERGAPTAARKGGRGAAVSAVGRASGDWPGSAVTVSPAGRAGGACRDPGIKAACFCVAGPGPSRDGLGDLAPH